eukprot:8368225-Pyramimonas_sp.AAC.2
MLLRFYGGPSPVPAVTARVPKCRCKSVTAEYVFRRTAELYIVQSHPSVAMISTTLSLKHHCHWCSFDQHSYGFCDVGGTKTHRARVTLYGAAFKEGDVVGMYIYLGNGDASGTKEPRPSQIRSVTMDANPKREWCAAELCSRRGH